MIRIARNMQSKNLNNSLAPKLSGLRYLLVFTFLTSCLLWPFSGLTVWHFIFFIILSFGIYYSYSRYVISLIIYLMMMLIYWIIIPVIQNRIGIGYYTSRVNIPEFSLEALVFVIIHMFGIFMGYHIRLISGAYNKNYRHRFSFLGVFFGLIFLGGLVSFLGVETIALSRVDQGQMIESNTYTLFLENITKLLPAFLLAYFVIERGNGIHRNIGLPVFILLLLCLIIVSNPVNTARFISLFGILIILLSYAIKYSKLRFLAWLLVLSPLYAFLVLPLTSLARLGLNNVSIGYVLTSLQTLEFSSYSIFLDALKIDNFANENYLISHLLIFMPRSLWPEKADSIGVFVAENSGYVYHNVGLISFFNAFADYGYIGLFLISLSFGLIAKNLNPVNENPSFRNRRFIYGVIFTGLAPMVFRGDLSTTMIAFYAATLAYEVTRFLTRFRLYVK